jgi:hypothetical protein
MNCSIGHYLHDVQASSHIIHTSFLIRRHGSEFHDTDSAEDSWHFLLETDGVASRGIPAHQRPTAVGEVAGGGGRKREVFLGGRRRKERL